MVVDHQGGEHFVTNQDVRWGDVVLAVVGVDAGWYLAEVEEIDQAPSLAADHIQPCVEAHRDQRAFLVASHPTHVSSFPFRVPYLDDSASVVQQNRWLICKEIQVMKQGREKR